MRSLCASILLALCSLLQLKECSGTQFTIISPSMFRIDTDETVVLNLHGYGNSRVRIQAHLQDLPDRTNIFSQKDFTQNAQEPISFTMKAPSDRFEATTIKGKSIEMKVVVTSDNYEDIDKSMIVYLTGKSDYIFVQTERPIYRPGEIVHIRVVPLYLQMIPIKDVEVEVTVQTPDGIGIWKKSRMIPPNDFVEFTFTVSVDPPIGTWSVVAKLDNVHHVSNGTAVFKVKKYVLPTFHVNLKVNQSYIKPGEEITAFVEAKYSYGKPVRGSCSVSAFVFLPNSEDKIRFKNQIRVNLGRHDNGMKAFTVPTVDIPTEIGRSWKYLIDEKATVTVQISVLATAEGISEGAARSGIAIIQSPYEIDASATSLYFIPSLNQDLKIVVRDTISKAPVPNVPVSIAVEGNPSEEKVSDRIGEIESVIETRTNSRRIQLTLKTQHPDLEDDHQATLELILRKFNSRSGSYLRISRKSPFGHATVGTDMNFALRIIESEPSEIRYLVIARGIIVTYGRKTRPGSATEVPLAVTTSRKMSPSVRIVAYYLDGNEVVSDSIWVDVSDVCTSKELVIKAPSTVKPGKDVEIKLEGESEAMVGLSAVDTAAYFLNSEGRLTRDSMFKQMNSFDMGCLLSGGKNSLDVFKEAGLAFHGKYASTAPVQNENCRKPTSNELGRSKRSASNRNNNKSRRKNKLSCYEDGILTSLAGETCNERTTRVEIWEIDGILEKGCTEEFRRGCKHQDIRKRILQQLGRSSGSSDDNMLSVNEDTIRSNFEESWIWAKEDLSRTGKKSFSEPAHDSITTYDIDAIGVHNTGFCIAKPAKVTVFKEIFIQLYLPYSVKVSEQVEIRAAVFNYHQKKSRQLQLWIKVDENFCTPYNPGKWSMMEELTVANQSSETFSFTGIPMIVPQSKSVEIQLLVKSTEDNETDAISKSLRVEEPGTIEEFSGNFELDPLSQNSDYNINLNFSDANIVPGTKKCWIYGYMSFLGPIIEFDPISETPKSLADTIKVPYGCGEQNMMVCGPNVFSFKYLKEEGSDRPNTEAEIKKFIIDGYTRQQTHRNSGVWSVHNSYPPTIWLNAYVNKVFLHAATIWTDMNKDPICDSIEWIIKQHNGDGSFSEEKHARYYTVNVALGGEVTLTAYVLISLTEIEIHCGSEEINSKVEMAITKAKTFLRRHADEDAIPYTAALTAYALILADSGRYSTRYSLQRLQALRTENAEEIFLKSSTKPATIEATSYALLAQITAIRPRGNNVEQTAVNMINKISRWLVRQRNSEGGFLTAQSTVVAVQALTEYGRWILLYNGEPLNPHLELTLTSETGEWQNGSDFNLDSADELYKKELVVPTDVVEGSRNINVAVAGEGIGSLSYRCIYRITHDSKICDFKFNATTEIDDNKPKILKLVIVLSKLTTPDTSMAMIDINLISGYEVDDSTLDRLVGGTVVDGVVDRYEKHHRNVKLYVNKIPGPNEEGQITPVKLAFNLRQMMTVRNPNPARISVYDMTNPEVSCSKFYSVPSSSPTIRMSCHPNSLDSNSKQCKCAEGGCLKCRTREEQVAKTCGTKNQCYSECVGNSDCLHLHESICHRNFGLAANMTEIDTESMPGYVKIRMQIETVFRSFYTGDLLLKSANQQRIFVIRRDCYEKCTDSQLAKSGIIYSDYFAVGRKYLIMGRTTEKILTADESSSLYHLDNEAIVERIVSPEKCLKYKKKRDGCRRTNTDKCIRIRGILRICDNIDDMKRGIDQGCDI